MPGTKLKIFFQICLKWGQGILEILCFFPILFTLIVLLVPGDVWGFLLSLASFYLLGLIFGIFLARRSRFSKIACALLVALSLSILAFQNPLTRVFVFLLGSIIFIRSLKLYGEKWANIFPGELLWIGLLQYLLGGLIYNFTPTLMGYTKLFAWLGFTYMVFMLFILNSTELKRASLSNKSGSLPVPNTVIKSNRLLILISIIIPLFINYFDWLREAFGQALRGFIGFLGYIISSIIKLFDFSKGSVGDPGGPGIWNALPDLEAGEPSLLAIIAEKVLIVFVVFILLFLLWLGLRHMPVFLKSVYEKLVKYLKGRTLFEENEGFIDEKERLAGLIDIGKEYRNRFQDWLNIALGRGPKWKDLKDNRQKIRFLYRGLVLKAVARGYTYKEYLTPKETAKDIGSWEKEISAHREMLSSAYDLVRYGEDMPEDRIVHNLTRAFSKD